MKKKRDKNSIADTICLMITLTMTFSFLSGTLMFLEWSSLQKERLKATPQDTQIQSTSTK